MTAEEKAQAYLKKSKLFRLGELVTESRHPLTRELSQWAQQDLGRGIQALAKVDHEALKQFIEYKESLLTFRSAVQDCLNEGGRVFLCGCGATGRLSLTIEAIWRELDPMSEKVQAFMAGGDTAIVHSLEGFEDYPEFGARQLEEMGFQDSDLLVASTEGGETPYVIGAAEAAAKTSKRPPYFLYCNPDELLSELVERSKNVIENPQIKKLNLSVGPMAVSGSTRMQASTVLQLAVGWGLFPDMKWDVFVAQLLELSEVLQENADLFLPGFIEREAEVYKGGGYLLYELKDHHITVFTDTTERSPTFSLPSFQSSLTPEALKKQPSLCHILISGTQSPEEAWLRLLRRKPRALNWMNVEPRTSDEYTMGFDFSQGAREFRQSLLGDGVNQESFYISCSGENFQWQLMDFEMSLDVSERWHPIVRHSFLKILLNIHSTLVMGRLGRYEGNVMTYVYPTNGKLVDRATRYAQALLEDQGQIVDYEKVVHELFRQFEKLAPKDSVVRNTAKALAT